MRVDPLDALKRGRAKLWAFLVGINDYEDERLCSLNFAVADCQGFASALNAVTELFPKREILVHCGTQHQPFAIAQMQARLERLFDPTDGVQPEDTVLFYFAGHGAVDPETQQLYLCLSSTELDALAATGLSIQMLLERLQAARVGKQVLILDACHCDKVEFFNAQLEATLHFYATQRRDFYALLSCSGIGQQSWEFADLGHGVFTHYLMEGLRGAAIDQQGQVDVDQLYRYVRDQTEQWVRDRLGKPQIPSHIKAGCRDIVIGVQPPEDSALVHEIGSLSEREKRYRQAVWQSLKQNYPIQSAKLEQLRTFADELLLPKESIKKIEADEIQSFKRDLENYKQRAISILHQHYPHDIDLFTQLRQKIGFSIQVLAPLEAEAFQVFHLHRQIYQSCVSNGYRQANMIQPATYRKLQGLKRKYSLSDEVARSLEIEVLESLNQKKLFYRSLLLALLAEHAEWNRELRKQLNQTQARLGFSNLVIAAIEQDAIATIPPSEVPPAFVPLSPQPAPIAAITIPVIAIGGLSMAAIFYQQQAYQTAALERDRITDLKLNKNYQACIQAASIFPPTSFFYAEVQVLHNQCRTAEIRAKLITAKEFAQQGKFRAAITISSEISQEDEVALEIQKLINTWAKAIWNVAKKHYDKGELKPAIAILKAMPQNASLYAEKQAKLQEWQQNWQRNRDDLENAKQARANREWNTVIQTGKRIKHPYWKKQAQPLIAEARIAQQAIKAEQNHAEAERGRTTQKPVSVAIVRPKQSQRQGNSEVARVPEFSRGNSEQKKRRVDQVAAIPKEAPVVRVSPTAPSLKSMPLPAPASNVRSGVRSGAKMPRTVVASRTGQPPQLPAPRPPVQAIPAARSVVVSTLPPTPQATALPEYSQVATAKVPERRLPPSPIPPAVTIARSTPQATQKLRSPSRPVIVRTLNAPQRQLQRPVQSPAVARLQSPTSTVSQTLLSSRLKTLTAKQSESSQDYPLQSFGTAWSESLLRPHAIDPSMSSPERSSVPLDSEALFPELESFTSSRLPHNSTDESLPPDERQF